MTAKPPNTELIDYQFKVMNERLEAHQEYTKAEFQSLHSKLDKFIESAEHTFVRTEELAPIREKQKAHDEIIKKFAWAFVWGFIAIVGAFIGITKFM